MHSPDSRRSSYSYTPSESFEYTPLQLASKEGKYEEVEILLEEKSLDVDEGPDPALHLALRKGHIQIALLLLEKGANFEIRDSHGDCPVHIVAEKGYLEVLQKLHLLGCNLETKNARGLYSLHLAAKKGHIHVVRYLCQVGCNIEVRNADNIRADITAVKYGHQDIADLLDRLRYSGQRDHFVKQLVPSSKPAYKLILRVFGNCAVGKTTFIKSLHAGLFSSLFRRSSSLQSNRSRPSSPITTQIEMDITKRRSSLTFDPPAHYHSTKGIHFQNINISGVGDVTAIEFSGQENYFPVYHHFLFQSPKVITVILFSLEDSTSVQIQQVCFWINFIMARQSADILPSEYGKIQLIATHVDKTRTPKNHNGEWTSTDAQKTLDTVKTLIPHASNLNPNVMVVDCTAATCHVFKHFKAYMSTFKHESINSDKTGYMSGLLESTLSLLGSLRKNYEQFPVLYRDRFYEIIRNEINILASDKHIDDMLLDLQRMGEIFCICDLVVICLTWFGTELIGTLLSIEFLANVRISGVYTSDDFQAYYTECDALGTLELLQSLHLCVQCAVDGEVEYELPIYNQTETLPGLWDIENSRFEPETTIYGGIELHTPPLTSHLLFSIFPFIQVSLRKAVLNSYIDNDIDLYQWFRGSKLSTETMEIMITLNKPNVPAEFIEIKIRGPEITPSEMFYFFSQVVEIIDKASLDMCPGLILEKHILSSQELYMYSPIPYAYDPTDVFLKTLDSESILDIDLYNPNINTYENLTNLILFGNPNLANEIRWGFTLMVKDLSAAIKLKISGLLDPPEPQGKDWCLLAFRLGLESELIASLDLPHTSRTMRLLNAVECTIGVLIANLHDLGRSDVAQIVLRSAPLARLVKTSVI